MKIAKLKSRLGIEVWKDIPEFEGLYQVSNLGNVRSLNYKRTGIVKKLTCSVDKNDRRTVKLYNFNTRKTYNVTVLIAITFLNHKPNGHRIVVDHINNDSLNDNLYNLQLITHRENLSKDKKGFTSKYTGVSWVKSNGKWTSNIRINGRVKHLGTFINELEAAKAYQNELNKIKEKEKL